MPSLSTVNLTTKAVLWMLSGRDDYSEITVSAGVEIPVRWEELINQQINAQGDPVAINGTIGVDRVITEGSILWEGKLADVPGSFTNELMEVVSMNRVPDIKGRDTQLNVTVRRFKNTLPVIA